MDYGLTLSNDEPNSSNSLTNFTTLCQLWHFGEFPYFGSFRVSGEWKSPKINPVRCLTGITIIALSPFKAAGLLVARVVGRQFMSKGYIPYLLIRYRQKYRNYCQGIASGIHSLYSLQANSRFEEAPAIPDKGLD